MKTERECELMAMAKLTEYVNGCGCGNNQDAINALTKMVGVALNAIDLVKNGKRETLQ
jgi:hypothetical protein